jgi:hypothetical protein
MPAQAGGECGDDRIEIFLFDAFGTGFVVNVEDATDELGVAWRRREGKGGREGRKGEWWWWHERKDIRYRVDGKFPQRYSGVYAAFACQDGERGREEGFMFEEGGGREGGREGKRGGG